MSAEYTNDFVKWFFLKLFEVFICNFKKYWFFKSWTQYHPKCDDSKYLWFRKKKKLLIQLQLLIQLPCDP